ncbi:hypothetical protein [Sutterella sp.]|uniref:hypothetical protein n=1 Tax=Sutterella sp. TaxID=1981025 RepID=UPI0026DEB119|nr:hypothetical protein [Sutterella sp.]MDO5530965.1 hypothetical protein [Sutterella sp.]
MNKLICTLLPAALVAGCAVGSSGPYDETPDFAPVSYKSVCLLANPDVKIPRVMEAVEAGLKRGGAEVKRIAAGSGTLVCPFVITYDLPSDDGIVSSIRFQSFEHGIPRLDAAGRAPKGKALTIAAVEAYAAEFLNRASRRGKPAEAEKAPEAEKPVTASTFRSVPNWQAGQKSTE